MSEGVLKIIRNYDDPFTHIENAILRDKRMSLAERGFFALCLSLPARKEMSLLYFAKVSGANKETVGKYFTKLEELGYLRRYQERGEHGVFGATIYEFNTSGASPCTDFPATAEPCTVEPAQKNKRIKNKTPKAPKGGDAELQMLFDRFWALYPRKRDKEAAWRAWKKLKPDLLLCSRMSIALKAQMVSEDWTKEHGKYIPYPSKWLNHRLWEDELPDAPPPPDRPAPHGQEAWGWEQ